MKVYRVVKLELKVLKQKELALQAVLNYFEEKRDCGFKVEQILEYNNKEITLLCSEDGTYHIDEDANFDSLI